MREIHFSDHEQGKRGVEKEGCFPVIDNVNRTVIDNFIRTVIDNFNQTVIDNIFIGTDIDSLKQQFLISCGLSSTDYCSQ
jgi:hypothetical protein